MASSTAELTLLLRAKFLAQGAVDTVSLSLDKVKTKAGDVKRALGDMGSSLSAGLGNLTENLLTGQDLGQAATNLGAFLAGETVQEFGTKIITKMAGSAVVQAIGGALGTLGASIGSLISTAIPIGMAAAPALILAAIVAAVAFLIANPEIREKVLGIAGDIIRGIVDGLASLAGTILGLIVAAPGAIADVVGGFVGKLVAWFLGIPGKLVDLGLAIVTTIIGGMVSLPGKIADIVRQAFANLKIDVGPFHISASGITIDLPNIDGGPTRDPGDRPTNHAGGGWVGLNGPELSWLGEKGPEYVVSNDELGRGGRGGAPVVIQLMLDGRVLGRLIDERLTYSLNDAAPTAIRG